MRRLLRSRTGIYPDDNLKNTFFVKAIPSKRKAYVGEPIVVTYKIYSATSFSNGQIQKLPVLNDFVSKDFRLETNPKAKREVYNGKTYMSIDVKKCIVYPSRTGTLTLDPLEISAFTDRFGRVSVTSAPEEIEVVDLPQADQYPGYTGGMGTFAISSSIDHHQISTDDIGTLTLTVGGEGNLDILNAPVTSGISAHFILGSPRVTVSTDSIDILKGKKTFTYNFSVDEPGDYEIPAIPFTYFDTDKNQFITLQTEPIKISVKQGELSPSEVKDKAAPRDQILAIKEGAFPAKTRGKIWAVTIPYISALLLSLFAVPAWLRRKKVVEKVKSKVPESTNKVALGRLRKAKELMTDPDEKLFYEEISKSVWLYLSDRLGISLSELNKYQLVQRLKEYNMDNAMITRTEDLITECEMALYAQYHLGQQKDKVLQDATALITDYETRLK
ncbi:MAG: BatD family protein [Taibaiella sp.]|nr:BatD family protein [Taibaiella sp.]